MELPLFEKFSPFNVKERAEGNEVVINQQNEAELNIILPKVNNFDIKQKKSMEYLFYYMPPTPNKIWQYKGQ